MWSLLSLEKYVRQKFLFCLFWVFSKNVLEFVCSTFFSNFFANFMDFFQFWTTNFCALGFFYCSKSKKMHKISEKMAEKVEHTFANLLDVHEILETFLSLFQKIYPPKFSGTDSKMCSRILWTSKNPRTQEFPPF